MVGFLLVALFKTKQKRGCLLPKKDHIPVCRLNPTWRTWTGASLPELPRGSPRATGAVGSVLEGEEGQLQLLRQDLPRPVLHRTHLRRAARVQALQSHHVHLHRWDPRWARPKTDSARL